MAFTQICSQTLTVTLLKKKNQSRYIRKETGQNVALYRRMIQTVTMNQFFGECFDLEKKPMRLTTLKCCSSN